MRTRQEYESEATTMSKLELARYIVKVLWNMPNLPEPDHFDVRPRLKRTKSHLINVYVMARKAEDSRD